MMRHAIPHYSKVGRYLVRGSRAVSQRRAVLEAVTLVARRFGGRVVAEGVEEAADLEAVMAEGIELVQGFIFLPALPYAALVDAQVFGGALPLPRSSGVAPAN